MGTRKLGILDFGYFNPPNIQAVDTINFTFQFVSTLEKLGYSRYWMAEHYNDYCSWTNPELLIGLIAGSTEKLKIGAAGIAIYYHNPFRVASAFKMLSALYPDRIDMGISRGAVPKHMLKYLIGKKDLTQKILKTNVEELLYYFSDKFLYKEHDNYIPMPPYGGSLPNRWILGGSIASALYAGSLNTNLSLSLFHNKNTIDYYSEVIKNYRNAYFKQYDTLPVLNVAVQCTCINAPEKLRRFINESNINIQDANNMNFAGNANYCIDVISNIYERLQVEEIIVYDHNRNLNDRLEAVNLIGGKIINN